MKNIKGILFAIIILIVLTPSSAFAQDGTPPEATEMPTAEGEQPSEADSPADFQKEVSLNRADPSSRNLSPSTDPFTIASFELGTEMTSQVAYGNGYYFVVYEKDGNIWGALYDEDYFLWQTMLSNTSFYNRCSSPDVAYEAGTNQFVATWMYNYGEVDSSDDIRARAIEANGSALNTSDIFIVRGTYMEERYPSIACNSNDQNCVIVYTLYESSSYYYINGDFVDIEPADISAIGYSFRVSTTSGHSNPYIAWLPGSYLVAYTNFSDPGNRYALYSHLYEDYNASGDQYTHNSTYFSQPGDTGYADHYVTSITADRYLNRFLFLYDWDFYDDGSDWDIKMRSVHATAQSSSTENVASFGDHENYGDIAYIHDPAQPATESNKFAVVYERFGDEFGIFAAILSGNGNPSSPDYSRVDLEEIDASGTFSRLMYPSVAGGSGAANLFIAYTDQQPNGVHYDYDLLGIIMDAGEKCYLPLMIE